MMKLIFYYQNKDVPLSYSSLFKISQENREEKLKRLKKEKEFLVEIIAFCLMPTHFHLLLKQIADNGISIFMSNLSNSYTRYFNTNHRRSGHLFQGKFKAIRIVNEEQLLHLSRYIHLNPYSAQLVKNLKELEQYRYSSFPEYLYPHKSDYCCQEIVIGNFKNVLDYKKFVFHRADYQRELEEIKNLLLENHSNL